MTPTIDTKNGIKIQMWHLPMIPNIQEDTSMIKMWDKPRIPKIQVRYKCDTY